MDGHTEETLKDSLLEIFAEWEEQLVAVTTDSRTNVKITCQLLRSVALGTN